MPSSAISGETASDKAAVINNFFIGLSTLLLKE